MEAPKTTNTVESFHNALQGTFSCKHPAIWKLFDGLKIDIGYQRTIFANAQVMYHEPKEEQISWVGLKAVPEGPGVW